MLLGRFKAILVQNYILEIVEYYLIDTKLHQLHRQFGHPLVQWLMRVLQQSGHEVNQQVVEHLTKYYNLY